MVFTFKAFDSDSNVPNRKYDSRTLILYLSLSYLFTSNNKLKSFCFLSHNLIISRLKLWNMIFGMNCFK